jgi:hypothetical protein
MGTTSAKKGSVKKQWELWGIELTLYKSMPTHSGFEIFIPKE